MFVLFITKKVIYLYCKNIIGNKYKNLNQVMKESKMKIVVPTGAITKLMEATGICQAGVYNALAYRCNSDAAKRIRARALAEFKGKKILKEVEV